MTEKCRWCGKEYDVEDKDGHQETCVGVRSALEEGYFGQPDQKHPGGNKRPSYISAREAAAVNTTKARKKLRAAS